MTPLLAVLLLYVAAQLAIAVGVARRIRTESDYLVAGRSLGYPLAIASLFATWFGAETCVGAAGEVYGDGLSAISSEPFGYGLCLVLMGLVFAAPLARRRLTTLADLFRERYSPGVERMAALVLIPSSLFWAAAQVRAFAQVLTTSSTWELDTTLAVAALLVIGYAVFGGMLADAITDLIQGVALVVGLGVLLAIFLGEVGGWSAALERIDTARLRPFDRGDASWLATIEAWAVPVCGSVVATELVARALSCRSPEVAKRSAIAAGVVYVLVGCVPVFLALAGAGLVGSLDSPEQMLPALALELLPAPLYALFAGALVSAILSTVDSALLTASALLSHNVLLPVCGELGERAKVRLARGGVVVLGLCAYLMARRADRIYDLIAESSAFGSAGALVLVAFGLFSKRGGAGAAYGALSCGLLAYVAGKLGALEYAFVLSLLASLLGYGLGALLENALRSEPGQGLSARG